MKTPSADEKLLQAYEYILMIKTCKEIRQDYAVQFVSPTEDKKARENTKRIEAHFKPELKLSTDDLWNKTVAHFQNYPPSGIDVLAAMHKQPLTALKSDCETALSRNKTYTEMIFGKDRVSKDF